jgi:hypothetical protein
MGWQADTATLYRSKLYPPFIDYDLGFRSFRLRFYPITGKTTDLDLIWRPPWWWEMRCLKTNVRICGCISSWSVRPCAEWDFLWVITWHYLSSVTFYEHHATSRTVFFEARMYWTFLFHGICPSPPFFSFFINSMLYIFIYLLNQSGNHFLPARRFLVPTTFPSKVCPINCRLWYRRSQWFWTIVSPTPILYCTFKIDREIFFWRSTLLLLIPLHFRVDSIK